MRFSTSLTIRTAAILAVSLACGLYPVAPAASAITTASSPVFYLALGASTSVGVQPSTAHPHGYRTHHGYVNDITATLATRGVTLSTTQLGCPGETTLEMATGHDGCRRATSQLAAAAAFLRTHRNDPVLVTVDLGFNDVAHCVADHVVDSSCVDAGLAAIKSQLAIILTTLRAVAGPRALFVGLNHYNPYAAAGPPGSFFVAAASDVIHQLNNTLAAVYAASGVPVADVYGAFLLHDPDPTHSVLLEPGPDPVSNVCALTWMCHRPPIGHNIHPNRAGYEVMAQAVLAALPVAWPYATRR